LLLLQTTLLDVLADRKTGGHIEGDVRVNGHKKEADTFARVSGYGTHPCKPETCGVAALPMDADDVQGPTIHTLLEG
jgi:hypothetical protein